MKKKIENESNFRKSNFKQNKKESRWLKQYSIRNNSSFKPIVNQWKPLAIEEVISSSKTKIINFEDSSQEDISETINPKWLRKNEWFPN